MILVRFTDSITHSSIIAKPHALPSFCVHGLEYKKIDGFRLCLMAYKLDRAKIGLKMSMRAGLGSQGIFWCNGIVLFVKSLNFGTKQFAALLFEAACNHAN